MKLYISAERENTYFVDTLKKYCDDSNGRHSWIFLPDMPALPGETLTKRINLYILTADLVFMDVTPRKYEFRVGETTEEKWFTNQGVLIEFGIVFAIGRIEDLKVYCLVSPDRLHQCLRERIVDPYPTNDGDAFLQYIDRIVSEREREAVNLLRQARVAGSLASKYPEFRQ